MTTLGIKPYILNWYLLKPHRFSFWLAGNSSEAEDLTSETFVRAWVGVHRIRTETLKAYLFTIARTLPEIDRTAFVLRVQHELPYAEVARILELSLMATKVKVHRVRKKLIAACLGTEAL